MDDSELIYQTRVNSAGTIIEKWINSEGDLFRINGPAFVETYSNGSKEEYWCQISGMRHRVNGSAVISYSEDGTIVNKEYWINGVQVNA